MWGDIRIIFLFLPGNLVPPVAGHATPRQVHGRSSSLWATDPRNNAPGSPERCNVIPCRGGCNNASWQKDGIHATRM